MNNFLRWLREWDWRALARLIVWTLVAIHFGYITKTGLAHLGRELILSWLLTFGILTHLQLILLMIGVRLYLALDDAAYWLAERIARPIVYRAPFAVGFMAAFAVEIVLVRGAVGFWRMAHMETRLLGIARVVHAGYLRMNQGGLVPPNVAVGTIVRVSLASGGTETRLLY